jgi:hypothetical protein
MIIALRGCALRRGGACPAIVGDECLPSGGEASRRGGSGAGSSWSSLCAGDLLGAVMHPDGTSCSAGWQLSLHSDSPLLAQRMDPETGAPPLQAACRGGLRRTATSVSKACMLFSSSTQILRRSSSAQPIPNPTHQPPLVNRNCCWPPQASCCPLDPLPGTRSSSCAPARLATALRRCAC